MYTWLIVFFSLSTIIVPNHLTEACLKCSKHTYRPYSKRLKHLARLPGSRKLNDLALIGTHSSFSYRTTSEKSKTQDLNIEQQLQYGIRVLDIEVKPKCNLFELYVNNISDKIYFHDVFIPIHNFLNDNPGEFIIIHINQVPDSIINNSNPVYPNCKIIDFHIKNIYGGWYLTKNWTLEDHIENHRGKILLATSDESFSNCAFNIKKHCHVQSDQVIRRYKKSPNFFHKWDFIASSIEYSKLKSDHRCYLNDISFNNHQQSPRSFAIDGGYKLQSECAQPINKLMTEKFINPHRALIIIFADFVTQELIDLINSSNFLQSPWLD
ncbi:GSCOCG00011366001-RA-CDS [Cotesia congregata]|uniref:Similar to plcA: 1-phosphatidylinositol phosphodiesterase (Listeria monocytogenes serovar 1/2a (Strain ATCC BAA-679 / EGD-e)) n=1 Tax=Cotesia congregata TaxID=51543 RepID=A0A8J2HE94_COTCN|nr:GSCOCG00011366001-RA-CDS [Cotesia congregata]CAG5096145.1 Similar to plcA: 1-phosphatidylinositol phosphodiesterase (Listeria monocytogenes serovar 1/2a (strain ATCC BAA-679 / EGD-e)) [Cotesia congregata]